MGVMWGIWPRRSVPRRPRPTRFAHLTPRGQQCAPPRAVGQHIQARTDGLGRQLFIHVVRMCTLEPPSNLLGQAPLGQVCSAVVPQPGIQELARLQRLTVLGVRLNIVAIVRNEWPRASPRLKVSRSSALMCLQDHACMATP